MIRTTVSTNTGTSTRHLKSEGGYKNNFSVKTWGSSGRDTNHGFNDF